MRPVIEGSGPRLRRRYDTMGDGVMTRIGGDDVERRSA